MIEEIERGAESSKARVFCDDCGACVTVTCDYQRRGNGWVANRGQILRKLKGWAMVAGKLRCPACELVRRPAPAAEISQPEADMSNTKAAAKPAAGPGIAMETAIIGALLTAYDQDAGRYIGAETDKSVAEYVGKGCMPGWVAIVREARFGPDGNEEVQRITARIDELTTELAGLKAQVAACVKAHDRRVGAK